MRSKRRPSRTDRASASTQVTSVPPGRRRAVGLGWREVKLTAPVFPGDTVYARTTIRDALTTFTEGYKADGTVFLSFERSCLIPKRGHAVDD